MKIGIDARLIGETGVGRYIRNLIRELGDIDSVNQYILFFRKRDYHTFSPPNDRWTKRLADVSWHSVREQIVMPWLFTKEHLDLVHIPYFNAPILYFGKYIITIHDLTILQTDTGKATTLPYFFYKIRRFGYRIVLGLGIMNARKIITVSKTVKDDIIKHFGINQDKIIVTYEGIDPNFLKKINIPTAKSSISGDYFLYVGNVYPHKNIELMLEAYREYQKAVKKSALLVFVGPDDYFYRRLAGVVYATEIQDHVLFLHDIGDVELHALYANAIALLFPSRMEGFGLPALEALAAGCPVIVSDIPIFREILEDFATFVDTRKPGLLKDALVRISEHSTRREMSNKIKPFLLRYNWHDLAVKTYDIYLRVGTTL
ncbi:MAG TPA: glycosyltransferase family 1 protein [Patescibacteria group bacterium]|nr:glycosyltransferase family 1 protein [Patescibacteria group bacterium]